MLPRFAFEKTDIFSKFKKGIRQLVFTKYAIAVRQRKTSANLNVNRECKDNDLGLQAGLDFRRYFK